MAKAYCGRFPINKGLTKLLNFEDFVIFRDPEYGLYTYSEKRDLEVNLMCWNCTREEAQKYPRVIEGWIIDIKRACEENVQSVKESKS